MKAQAFGALRYAALCAALFYAPPVAAVDVVINAPEALTDSLTDASALAGLEVDQTTDGQVVVAAARTDYQRLINALYRQGYFAPVIRISINGTEAANISPVVAPRFVNSIVIAVEPGEVFKFGTTKVAPIAPETTLPAEFAAGERASVGAIRDTAKTVVDDWRANGHATANIDRQTITARHPAKTLDVDLRVSPGPIVRFGQLNIRGNAAVRTERVRDIADFPVGKVFSPDQVKLVAARLRRVDAFRSVSVREADTLNADGTLDIDLQITENLPRRFGFGAEVSSLEGLSVSGFWLHRNLLGGAERLQFDVDVSGIGGDSGGTDYTIGTRFDRPATFNGDTHFYAQAELQRLDEVRFRADSFSIEAGITRIASNERTYELGLGYLFSETRDDFGDRNFQLLTLPLQATFDYRNNKLDATSGYFLNAQVTPFIGVDGSEGGARLYGDARAYYTIGDTRPLTIAGRLQMGSLVGPDIEDAYPEFLFYSGGSGTVRGHSYQSLGITLPSGQTVGGKSFVGLSTEARLKITDAIGLVGFIDAGYIGDTDLGGDGLGGLQTGAGIGARYDTGIGPIRVDIALPVSGPGDSSGVEIYIGIGQAF